MRVPWLWSASRGESDSCVVMPHGSSRVASRWREMPFSALLAAHALPPRSHDEWHSRARLLASGTHTLASTGAAALYLELSNALRAPCAPKYD